MMFLTVQRLKRTGLYPVTLHPVLDSYIMDQNTEKDGCSKWSVFRQKGFVSGEEKTGILKEDQEPGNPGGRLIPQRSRMRVKLRER